MEWFRRSCCIVLLLAAAIAACKKKTPPPPPPPPEVAVVTVQPRTIPIWEEWITTLDGYVNAQIRAQVTGYLLTQNYAEGHQVKKGDLMFQIDPRPFQAALDQAKGRLSQDEAQLEKTRLDVKRFTPLAQDQAISRQELDNAVQANLAAEAQVKADRAAVRSAQLNLGFTRIEAPVDGLAGIARAQIGDLVSPASEPLTTVSTIDPIKAYFYISEAQYLSFWRQHLSSTSSSTDVDLQLVLSNNTPYGETGKAFFAERQINLTTGTLQVVGLFPNPQYVLRPGQYGRVRAQTRVRQEALAVPQRAVNELQGTYLVAVVNDQNRIHIQPVKLGEQVGTLWIIDGGLKPGERVVVEGTQKVREGVPVRPKPIPEPVSDLDWPTNPAASSAREAR